MFKKLAHISIAVKDLETSSKLFSRLLDVEPGGRERVDQQKVEVAFFQVGETKIELTKATSPDSPIAKFLEKRGEGIHHISFEVDDIHAEIDRLKEAGFQLLQDKPTVGADEYRVAFLHPKSTSGVLLEISQKKR
ncbi:MAG: methylmalonyl-CoA epimerase [Bacteroidota bacterium]